jgi:Predicted membrane protein
VNSQPSLKKDQTAPPPDAAGKPETPPQVKKQTWKYSLRRTIHEFVDDQCPDIAATLTYYGVLSMFPALLALVALLGLVGQAETTTDALLDAVSTVAPGQAVDLLRDPIQELVNSPAAGLAFIGGLLGAVWSASAYVGAFSRAMNRIYEIDEGRPFWKLRPMMLLMTVIALIFIAIMGIILGLSGPLLKSTGDALGLGEAVLAVWNIAKWPILVLLAVVILALLYYFTPNVKQPKFRWMSLGALIALVVLAIASAGFAFYIANFSSYNRTYGAIGGVIVLLLWVWIVNLALLFGAEFDSETERGRQLQAGIQAEETLQLPPRDSKRSEKRRKAEEDTVAAGRELRQELGQPNSDRRP